MKYNKYIGLKGNIFLLKNKIKNIVFRDNVPYTENFKELNYKPLINVVGNINIHQTYDNIIFTKKGEYLEDADYVCVLNEDYILNENTIYNMVKALQIKKYDMVYSDEYIGDDIFYKPDWSPDTFKSFDYVGLALIKKSNSDNIKDIYHISKPLYKSNRKLIPKKRVLKNIDSKISIIIPSKDNYYILKRCIDSIRNKSSYKNYEIIVVDNGSADPEKYKNLSDKYIYNKMDFNFSKMCNIGTDNADGEYLLFLNDDTEVITENWLEILAGYACENYTGAVGAKLYYPNSDIIQHCGVININAGPVHYLLGMSDSNDIYFGRNRFSYNVSAVTAACLMIQKCKFNRFDEDFKVGYNDVDLCLGLIEKGYYNVIVNDVKLYHYESLSRGDDRLNAQKLKRLALEKEKLYNKHRKFCCNDMFYNVNLSKNRADFSYDKSNISVPKNQSIKSYKNIDYKLEYSFFRDGVLYIGGYVKSPMFHSVYIVFGEKAVKAHRELRQDMTAIYGKNYSLCGFSAKIFTDEEKEFKIKIK